MMDSQKAVTPVNTGVQKNSTRVILLDSGLRRNDAI